MRLWKAGSAYSPWWSAAPKKTRDASGIPLPTSELRAPGRWAARALARVTRPVVVELWGHGRSPTPEDARLYHPDAYVAVSKAVAALGVEGKWAIHPSQIELANQVFTPPETEVDRAPDAVEAMRNMAMVYYRRMVRHPAALKVQFQAIAEVEDPDIARQLHQDQSDQREGLPGALQAGRSLSPGEKSRVSPGRPRPPAAIRRLHQIAEGLAGPEAGLPDQAAAQVPERRRVSQYQALAPVPPGPDAGPGRQHHLQRR